LFLAFEITYKAEVKYNCACHVKAWAAQICYISMHSDIQHWIEVSAECDVPAAVIPPLQPAAELIRKLWEGGWENYSACLDTLEESKFQKGAKLRLFAC